jgi:hypothetical protein
MTSKLVKFAATAGAVAFAAWAGNAYALEGNSPYLPGVSVGIPTGALPPAGFYASDDNVIITGGLRNSSGNALPGNVNVYLNIPSVLWVPGWNILGATYGAAIVEPYAMQNVNVGPNSGSTNSTSSGMFNTIISPINLSWNFAPFFVKVGFSIYVNDGDTNHGTSSGVSAIANNYWTFEPDVALSWLQNGINLTLHAVVDTNTKDTHTNYQSGDVFYLDWTASKALGKWTFGVGGNFTQQFSNDTNSAGTVANSEIEHVLVGPLMGYNFGPAEINAKALFGVQAQNTFNASFYHLGVSFPF